MNTCLPTRSKKYPGRNRRSDGKNAHSAADKTLDIQTNQPEAELDTE